MCKSKYKDRVLLLEIFEGASAKAIAGGPIEFLQRYSLANTRFENNKLV